MLSFLKNFQEYYKINEEVLISDIKVGDKVFFLSDLVIQYSKMKLKNKSGVIKSIKKEFGYSSIKIKITETKEEIVISSSQLKCLMKIDDKKDSDEYIEKIKNGDLVAYKASPIFNLTLKSIKFVVSEKYVDISNFDIDNKEPSTYASFIPARRCGSKDKEKYRQISRVGRILKKLNPNYSEAEIEKFVDSYRAECSKESEVTIVAGSSITYWYLGTRYAKGGGSLNNSCMRHDHTQLRIDGLYAKNSDKIAMAVIIKDNKLYARAIVWKLDNGDIYMDRIYSINGTYSELMKKYAASKHWKMYPRLPKTSTVTLKTAPKNDPPYLDSFNVVPFSNNHKLISRF